MAYLYTPPQWRNVQIMEGALRYGIPTSTVTYKLNGVWYNTQTPAIGETDGATWMFYTPTIVDSATAAELTAFGVGTVTTV